MVMSQTPTEAKSVSKKKAKRATRPKTGGRSKGTPNHDYQATRVVPVRCPTCTATEVSTFRVIARQSYKGVAPDGEPFTQIVRKRGKCDVCGQMLIITEYRNDCE